MIVCKVEVLGHRQYRVSGPWGTRAINLTESVQWGSEKQEATKKYCELYTHPKSFHLASGWDGEYVVVVE